MRSTCNREFLLKSEQLLLLFKSLFCLQLFEPLPVSYDSLWSCLNTSNAWNIGRRWIKHCKTTEQKLYYRNNNNKMFYFNKTCFISNNKHKRIRCTISDSMAIICSTTDKFYKFMNINVIPIIPFWYVAVNALICFTHSKP